MVALRDYQSAAVSAVYDYIRAHDDAPVVSCPVGSGKSWILAQIASDTVQRWNGQAIVLAHRRELLEQNADKIRRLCPEIEVGIYSAGLRQRNTSAPVICAAIQSVYQKACELPPADLILADECHLISGRDDSMYGQFLRDMRVIRPHCRLVGVTATAFRADCGLIYGPDRVFGGVCYEVGLRELIQAGHLTPLVSKAGITRVDTSGLHVRAGEFVSREVEELVDDAGVVEAACREIVELTRERKSVLIFSAGVRHGRHVQEILQDEHGIEAGFVCGDTPRGERDDILARFKGEISGSLLPSEPLRFVINSDLLTTGFDCPAIDCVALLRPTMSPGLLVQMAGRGTRLAPEKQDCLLLDYGGNIERHGPIDQISIESINQSQTSGEAPAKECPDCHALIATGYSACPDCGHEFPPPERQQHDEIASHLGVLSDQHTDTTYDVLDVDYRVHTKRGADDDAPKTLRVTYHLGLDHRVSQWVCIEHRGYAQSKAIAWWTARSPDPVPKSARRAVEIAAGGGLAWPQQITVREWPGRQWPEVIDVKLGNMSESMEECPVAALSGPMDLDELPF